MTGPTYRFGEFELDSAAFELRRQGRSLKLERIPMELLILLAEKNSVVVTRQEIIEQLWGKDVYVDTEHGINTAIRKIRQALKDDPDRPRFIQTVTGKGYRFIAEIVVLKPAEPTSPPPTQPTQPPPEMAVNEADTSVQAAVAAPSAPDVSSARPRAKAFVAALVLILLAFPIYILAKRLFPNHATQIHSIAVLPLTNLSGDASQDYFADGLTDELITALAKNRNLRIVSRTSVMQYKGAKRPLPEIARELNVDGILEGSITRAPNNVHVTVQLIYAPTDSHIWAESYDRDLKQAYLIPEDLSQSVAKEVKVATTSTPATRFINPEAHDAYLHGRYLWNTFDGNSLPYFQKAIDLQPDYAAAWAGLAEAYIVNGMRDQLSSEVSEAAHSAALKSLDLNPSLPEGHASLSAWYLFYGWDPTHAEIEAHRAVELDPNCIEGHHMLYYVYEVQLRYPEAETEAKRTAALEPYVHSVELGVFYMNRHRYEESFEELQLQRAARPYDSEVVYFLSRLRWFEGKYAESQSYYEQALEMDHDFATKAAVHKAWVMGGEPAVERVGVKHMKDIARKHYYETEFIASIVAFGGDKDDTLKYLELSYRNHDPNLIFIQNEPLFDFLHAEPRYRAIVKNMGLPATP